MFQLMPFRAQVASLLVRFAFLPRLCLHQKAYLNHFEVWIFGKWSFISSPLELFCKCREAPDRSSE